MIICIVRLLVLVQLGILAATAVWAQAPAIPVPSPDMAAAPRVYTIKDLLQAAEKYVAENSASGFFNFNDPQSGQTRKLRLLRVREPSAVTGNINSLCADFQESETGYLLDIDFDIVLQAPEIKIVAVLIHKDNGTERFSYDASRQRVMNSPVVAAP